MCSAKTYTNSNYETTGVAKTLYQNRVSITCNRGYETSGDVFCSVKEEGGDVNGLDLMAMDDWECGAKNCNARTIPNSASGLITGKTGDTVTVTCSSGYSTNSGASSGTVQCQTDGEFDALSCTGNKCAAKAYSNSNQDETNPVCFSFPFILFTAAPYKLICVCIWFYLSFSEPIASSHGAFVLLRNIFLVHLIASY